VTEPTILKVAVNVPLSRLFDYLAPAGAQGAEPGCRVLVPFGRQKQVGLVMERDHQSRPLK
jgi:primosomal protein N' (replication factor Y)